MLLSLARRTLASPRVRSAALAGAAGATLYAASAQPAECLLGFGGAKPDWDKIKKEIVALCDDEGAPNPSKDGASGSLGGGGYGNARTRSHSKPLTLNLHAWPPLQSLFAASAAACRYATLHLRPLHSCLQPCSKLHHARLTATSHR